MKPNEVFDRIVERLRAQDVELEETLHGVRGRGADAWRAWEAFCEVAGLAADEPFDYYGSPAHVDPGYCDNDLLLHESGSTDAGYQVDFMRDLSLDDEKRDHVGTFVVSLAIISERLPVGRVPQAQRWGYAGPARPGVDDESRAEYAVWAGHVDSWKRAVEASSSFKAMQALGPDRFSLARG